MKRSYFPGMQNWRIKIILRFLLELNEHQYTVNIWRYLNFDNFLLVEGVDLFLSSLYSASI